MSNFFPTTFNAEPDDIQELPDEVNGSYWDVDTQGETEVLPSADTRPKVQLTERDITMLRFVIRYGYTNEPNLARLVNSNPASLRKRLRQLVALGLLNQVDMLPGLRVYLPTRESQGLLLSRFQLLKRPPFALFQHTIALTTLGAEIEREFPDSADMLGLHQRGDERVPRRFKHGQRLWTDGWTYEDFTWGENTLTEREIRQGQHLHRAGRPSRHLREEVYEVATSTAGSELEDGKQGLFVLYGQEGKTGEHVPDLVIIRPRVDGKPAHIAVELELTLKSQKDYIRILRAYRAAGWLYRDIVWATPSTEIANALKTANETVGLPNLYVKRFVPRDEQRLFLG